MLDYRSIIVTKRQAQTSSRGKDFKFQVSVQDQFDLLLFGLGCKRLSMGKAKLFQPMAANTSLYSKTLAVPHASNSPPLNSHSVLFARLRSVPATVTS